MTTPTATEVDPAVLDVLANPTVVSAIEKAIAIERRIVAIRAEPFPDNQDQQPIKVHRGGVIHNIRHEQRQALENLHARLAKLISDAVRDAGEAS